MTKNWRHSGLILTNFQQLARKLNVNELLDYTCMLLSSHWKSPMFKVDVQKMKKLFGDLI